MRNQVAPMVLALAIVASSTTLSNAETISLFTMPTGGAGISDKSEDTSAFTNTLLSVTGGGAVSPTSGTIFKAAQDTAGSNTLASALANPDYASFTVTAPANVPDFDITISYDWVVTDNDNNATVSFSTYLLTDALPFADGN